MIIFPAIDLYQKKVVRLYKGDYQNMTVYSDNPLSVAKDFEAAGATHIHMVDLEGAKDGTTPNLSVVEQVAKETSLFVEIGGGIRDMETVSKYLSAGVSRVILGTAAVTNESFLREAESTFPGKIAAGADVKDGKIAIKGWLETADVTLDEFLRNMESIGIRNVICTDISRDGAMRGTNLELYKELSAKYAMAITASGGVSSLDDVRKLREMDLYGAIIGKAYFTGAIRLEEALEAAK
ncbi:MAG: 1-(5-phosphoribosyl)-5-[Oscillospiraceae bacterium]|nr:1-(5-phosphoribosyl)-5-[(5-phosphoribosylamino)methylideneamino]imidazole-4-carboxamide isomerase [Oscillospiraceae bacterium]